MKKTILIALCLLPAVSVAPARAAEAQVNVLLTGGGGNNAFNISLSADGRAYIIGSNLPLEAGGGICVQPEDNPQQLICEATAIAGFEANLGAGPDRVKVAPTVPVPVTLRGGPGNDYLLGGGAADKLIGGMGKDLLRGVGGDDWLFGGPDNDALFGEAGADRLIGGGGEDFLNGGPGDDFEPVGPGDHAVSPAPR